MNIPFVKMHANGNDFVIIDNRTKNYNLKKNIILKLAHRNTGIGFDQLVLLESSKNEDIFMKIFNSDGKEAKMCGNAGLCVASLLFASKNKSSIKIETISNNINAKLNKSGEISITIRVPSQVFTNILTKCFAKTKNIDFSGIHKSLNSGILVNMGNPHIVFVVDKLINIDLYKYGRKIENNELFTDGINTEIVEIVSRKKLKVKFWERGAGHTLSCGSGILSAFYACHNHNLCDPEVEIEIPIGTVRTYIKNSEITMSSKPEVCYMGEFIYE